ncbi:MAG TPA: TolC family protein [Gemmatimonadaceae bacterium]|nr:TolC family protein [Gemmatimonadaceae bacterium]
MIQAFPGATTVGAVLASLLVLLAAPAAAQQPAAPRPVSLEDALSLADERSEVVRIAEAQVSRARGQHQQARSAYFPQLEGTVGYQRLLQSQFEAVNDRFGSGDGGEPSGGADSLADNPLTRIFASPNTLTLGLSLQQPLFTGGRILAQDRAAAAGRRAADINLTSQQAQVRLTVTQAYYDAVLANRLVTIAESTLVQTERTFRTTLVGQEVGRTSEFELLRAQVARDNQRPRVIQARTQRETSLLRLKQLLELPANEPIALTTPLEDPSLPAAPRVAGAPGAAAAPVATTMTVANVNAPVDVDALLTLDPQVRQWVDTAAARADTTVEARAAVRQRVQDVDAQEQMLRATRAQRLPQLSLSSQYQRFAYPAGGIDTQWRNYFPNWTVSLGLSVPLFTGGRIRGQEMAAEASLVEARALLKQVQELAALDASIALAQLEQAAEAFAASAGTTQQAERAYSIAEVRYGEGLSTQVELADSRLLLQQAQVNRAQAARDLSVARVRLALLRDLPLSNADALLQTLGGAAQTSQPSAPSQQTTPGQQAGAARGAFTSPSGQP